MDIGVGNSTFVSGYLEQVHRLGMNETDVPITVVFSREHRMTTWVRAVEACVNSNIFRVAAALVSF